MRKSEILKVTKVLQRIDLVNKERKQRIESEKRGRARMSYRKDMRVNPNENLRITPLPFNDRKSDRLSFKSENIDLPLEVQDAKKLRLKYKKKLGLKFEHIVGSIKCLIEAVGMEEVELCLPYDQRLILLTRKNNLALLDQLGTAESISELFKFSFIELKYAL